MQFENQITPVYDKTEQLRRFDGDADLIQEVTQAFLQDMPYKVEALDRLLDKQSTQAISRQAHSIKGAAANAGAARMHELAARLEAAAKEADWKQIRKLASGLQQEWECFKKEVC